VRSALGDRARRWRFVLDTMSRSRVVIRRFCAASKVAEELHDGSGMSTRERVWETLVLLVTLLPVAPACSTTRAEADAGHGAGGSGGTHGDAGSEASTHDAEATGVPFGCGDASCIAGQAYCRVLAAPGGQNGNNGPTQVLYYDCPPLNGDCPARDCSCVTVNQGVYYCPSCTQLDSGAVVASCGKI
jgi:hypothetical protein